MNKKKKFEEEWDLLDVTNTLITTNSQLITPWWNFLSLIATFFFFLIQQRFPVFPSWL